MVDEDQYPQTIDDMSPEELGINEIDDIFDERSWGDKLIKKDPQENPKYRMLASMIAGGMTQKGVSEALGLTQSRVSVIFSNKVIKEMVRELQDKHGGREIEKRFRMAANGAMDKVEGIIYADDGLYKEQTVLSASTWLLEKVTGKATQTVDHKGNVLSGLLDKLDSMKRNKQDLESEVKELNVISPKDQELDAWVGSNIPDSVSVGDKSVKE